MWLKNAIALNVSAPEPSHNNGLHAIPCIHSSRHSRRGVVVFQSTQNYSRSLSLEFSTKSCAAQ